MVLKKTSKDERRVGAKVLTRKGWQYYWQLVRKKVILGFVLMLAVRIYFIVRYGWLVAMDRSGGYDWFFGIVIFVFFGLVLSRKISFTYRQVAMTGGAAGFCLGGLTAILDLLLFRNLWAVLNIIRKPLLFLVIGMTVSTIVYILVTNDDSSSNKNKLSKN